MRGIILVFIATMSAAPTLGCDLVPGYTPPTLEELVTPAKAAFLGTIIALRMRNGQITTEPPQSAGNAIPTLPVGRVFGSGGLPIMRTPSPP